MATTKPRITVTLTERQHEVLKIISDCGGQSMSSLLGELIEVSLPTFERMANTFQKLHQAKTYERSKMIEAFDQAQSVLEPIASEALNQFDLFLGKIEQGIAAPGPQRSEDTDAATTAPTVPRTNRGVTPNSANRPKSPSPKPSSRSSAGKVSRKK